MNVIGLQRLNETSKDFTGSGVIVKKVAEGMPEAHVSHGKLSMDAAPTAQCQCLFLYAS